MTGAALWGGVGPHPWPRAGGMNASSLFKPLLCPQLFGDVCYTCSHVIEGDGEAPHPPPRPCADFLPQPLSPALSGLVGLAAVCPAAPPCAQGALWLTCGVTEPASAPTVVSALNKAWCVHCFSCSTCNSRLTLK